MEMDSSRKEDEDASGGCCKLLQHFEEADLVVKTISAALELELSAPPHDLDAKLECAYRPVLAIFAKYQALPQLLDSHIDRIISTLVNFVRQHYFATTESTKRPPRNALFTVLYTLAVVRGPKTVVKFFSHEVCDLEALFELLSMRIDHSAANVWQTRYVLLLWLSFLVMLPFNVGRLSSKTEIMGVDARILELGRKFLAYSGKERDAAALLIGKLFARHDVSEKYLHEFLLNAKDYISSKTETNVLETLGIMQALCYILKFTGRDILIPLKTDLYNVFENASSSECLLTRSVGRKLLTKLVQRVGLVFLRSKTPKWQYERGLRSLGGPFLPPNAVIPLDKAPIQKNPSTKPKADGGDKDDNDDDDDDDDDDYEMSDEDYERIEALISALMERLSDKDTIVRWSAAKGVGRVSFRLSYQMAQVVVDSVLEIFSTHLLFYQSGAYDLSAVSECTWHGACSAVAELTRRGIILPQTLAKTIPWIEKALRFHVVRGKAAIGDQVRDAACYVCWSMARAYAPQVMRPFVHTLAPSLITASLFDREINVRRAASAAFQENVGRQGIFPHGIDIVNATDYFLIGCRRNAFLVAADKVARFAEYHGTLLEHLISIVIPHVDASMRQDGAHALGLLVKIDSSVFETCWARLIRCVEGSNICMRHGACLGLAAIASNVGSQQIQKTHAEKLVTCLLGIKAAHPQSIGQEITLAGFCQVIASIAEHSAVGGFIEGPFVVDLLAIVEESLDTKSEPLQQLASGAAAALFVCLSPETKHTFVQKWCKKLHTPASSPFEHGGLALALGELRLHSLESFLFALNGLTSAISRCEKLVALNPAAKRNAIDSIGRLLIAHEDHRGHLPQEHWDKLSQIIRAGLRDYTTSVHGDVGSWARMASIRLLVVLICEISCGSRFEIEQTWDHFLQVIGQAFSKINKVRELAGKSVAGMLGRLSELGLKVADGELLVRVFAATENSEWRNSGWAFARLCPLIASDSYRPIAVIGFAMCVAGGGDTMERDATSTLLGYLEQCTCSEASKICRAAIGHMASNSHPLLLRQKAVRAILEFLDIMYSSDCFAELSGELCLEVLENTKRINSASRDANMRLSALKLISNLGCVPDRAVQRDALYYLLGQLGHEFPRLRSAAAQHAMLCMPMYLASFAWGQNKEVQERTTAVISTIDWLSSDADFTTIASSLQQELVNLEVAEFPVGVS